ncbi:MAG: IPT/TIG domain-containing protein [Candidatus Krumholzibacteriia bacterium]
MKIAFTSTARRREVIGHMLAAFAFFPRYSRAQSGASFRRRAVWLVVFGLVFATSCGSEDESPTGPGPTPPTPAIDAVSDSVLAPGDTLSLAGRNFSTTLASNRVVFNNDLAKAIPFFSNGDSLAVVVPRWANSGDLHVTSQGVASSPRPVEIRRGVGTPWVISGGTGFDFKAAAPAGTEEYVLIPYSASGAVANFAYTVTPSATSTFPAAPPLRRSTWGSRDFAVEFELDIRRQAIEYIERYGNGKRPFERVARAAAAPAVRTFRVLKCTDCGSQNPANFKVVTADLKYDGGKRALVYADVNQPAVGAFTQADYDAFGAQFDDQIFPTDSTLFGKPSDIDNNQRVAILFTPEVNLLTPAGSAQTDGFISGFFLLNDIVPGLVPAGTSNSMEIFYAMVPDPNSQFGNPFDKQRVTGIIPSTLAHEFEHMISFGFRFSAFGIFGLQETWLEEGMAHMAEDLNGFDTSNKGRADLYLPDPGAVSLMGGDTLEQRGGIFLFLRYLGDQLGTPIYWDIVHDAGVGRAGVQAVTGEDFFTSVADFFSTLYLSDRGITGDPKYRFSSFNLQQAFAPLLVTSRAIADGAFGGSVSSAAGDFYVLSGLQSPAARFDVAGAKNSATRIVVIQVK